MSTASAVSIWLSVSIMSWIYREINHVAEKMQIHAKKLYMK